MFASKKQLAVFLSKLQSFPEPNPALEQYPTDSEIAAEILWNASMQEEITHKTVADFGCGTGILGIGALALGAKHVTFIELDATVFPTLMENLAFLESETGALYANYDIIQGNIAAYDHPVDVVIQNPPFGTRQQHADTVFLEKAIALAPIVYSLHKSSTEEFLRSWANSHHMRIAEERRYAFPLKKSMPQHQKKIERIDVTCIKLVKR